MINEFKQILSKSIYIIYPGRQLLTLLLVIDMYLDYDQK